MRKTYVLFGLALTLLVAALLVGLPRSAPTPTPPVTRVEPTPVPAAPSQDTLRLGRLVTLQGTLSAPLVLADQAGQLQLLLDLEAGEVKAATRPPMSIALVIDRSGSMAGPKMVQAKRAAKALVERLADDDEVALVTYSSDFSVDLALTRIKGQRARVLRVIDEILDGGGTNLAGGMTAGLKALHTADASRVRRVLLLSDGNANQGITDPATIASLAAQGRQRGITVSTLGVGVDFNEDLMTMVAQSAGGGYYYGRDGAAIAEAFDAELEGLLKIAARQVEVALELAEGVRIEEVYGYRTERRGDRVVVPVGDLASGAHRRVMIRLATDAVAEGSRPVANVVLAYEDARADDEEEYQGSLSVAAVTDAGEVAKAQRAQVQEAFTTAEAAQVRAEAAATFAGGDRQSAIRQVQTSLGALRVKNQALKSARVAAQVSEMERTLDALDGAQPESDAGKDLVKSEKLRAYESFLY